MIQRNRHPDGSNHDIDHGPGPVGKQAGRVLGGVPIAQAVPGMRLGLFPTTAAKAAYKREWAKRRLEG